MSHKPQGNGLASNSQSHKIVNVDEESIERIRGMSLSFLAQMRKHRRQPAAAEAKAEVKVEAEVKSAS